MIKIDIKNFCKDRVIFGVFYSARADVWEWHGCKERKIGPTNFVGGVISVPIIRRVGLCMWPIRKRGMSPPTMYCNIFGITFRERI